MVDCDNIEGCGTEEGFSGVGEERASGNEQRATKMESLGEHEERDGESVSQNGVMISTILVEVPLRPLVEIPPMTHFETFNMEVKTWKWSPFCGGILTSTLASMSQTQGSV